MKQTVFAAGLAGALAANAADSITIEPLPPSPAPADASAALTDAAAPFWQTSAPVWRTTNADIAVSAWIAAEPAALRLHVVVVDPAHSNDFHERNLWRGDCLYAALDGRADATPEELKTNNLALDDASFIFGLGDRGPDAVTGAHGDADRRAADAAPFLRSIVRDEAAKTTTYDVTVPWSALNTEWGLSDAVGVALTVAHKNRDGADTAWGRLRAGPDGPREYRRLRLPARPGPFVAIGPRRTTMPLPVDAAEAIVAVGGDGPAVARASVGAATAAREVEALPGGARFVVRAPAALVTAEADRLAVEAAPPGGATVARAFELRTPAVQADRVRARLAVLAATVPNDPAALHVKSVGAVVDSAFRNLAWEVDRRPERATTFIEMTAVLLRQLPAERFDWDRHVKQCRPLVFAFVSDADRSFQFYALQLPYGWVPDRPYPLTIYLHGMVGDVNPLNGLSTAFDNAHQDTLFREADIDPARVPPAHRGYILAPWGRGNQGYQALAEEDVFEAMADMKRRFRVDEERQYITGFSMGCNGAWSIAARTPQLWAGIGLAAGFGPWSWTAAEYLAENVRGIPVANWCGALDGMVEGARRFQETMDRKGLESTLKVIENVPHTYPYDHYQETVGRIMGRTRPPAARFSFLADTLAHPGRNGVEVPVPRAAAPDAWPRFTCAVEGPTVRIDSENAERLRVDAGEDGLGLQGDIAIVWNGREAYRGPAKRVDLPVEEKGK